MFPVFKVGAGREVPGKRAITKSRSDVIFGSGNRTLNGDNAFTITNMKGIFNDPLSQTPSLASSEHSLLVLLDFEKWGRTDVQTRCEETMINTDHDCGRPSGSIK